MVEAIQIEADSQIDTKGQPKKFVKFNKEQISLLARQAKRQAITSTRLLVQGATRVYHGTTAAAERLAFAAMDGTFFVANKVIMPYVDRTSRVGEVAASVVSMGSIVISYEFLLNNFSSAPPEYFQKYQFPLIAAACVVPSVLIGGILGKRFGLR